MNKNISRAEVRRVLERLSSCCLDNEEEREKVLNAIFAPPRAVYQDTLGPGISVEYDADGLLGFLIQTDDDRQIFFDAGEFDLGWREKLRRALGEGT